MVQLFRKRMSNRKGFTIIELLVVVAIIGILATIAIPKFADANSSARGAKVQADLRTIDSAAQLYYASAGATAANVSALTSASLLATTPTPPTGEIKIKGSSISASGGGSYVMSGGRATYNSSTVEQLPQ
jgi:prepilin-type N-terminal cleavage/methylation domain-containing protein